MIDLPVLLNTPWDTFIAVLCGYRDKPESWRAGFVTKDYWDKNTKTVNNQQFISLKNNS